MLGIGCPDRHALSRITSSKLRQPRRVLPSRASGFVHRRRGAIRGGVEEGRHLTPWRTTAYFALRRFREFTICAFPRGLPDGPLLKRTDSDSGLKNIKSTNSCPRVPTGRTIHGRRQTAVRAARLQPMQEPWLLIPCR